MDYGNVGVGPMGAPTCDGAGVGGVSYVGMVRAFVFPLQAMVRVPTAPAPTAGPNRFITPEFKNRFP